MNQCMLIVCAQHTKTQKQTIICRIFNFNLTQMQIELQTQ